MRSSATRKSTIRPSVGSGTNLQTSEFSTKLSLNDRLTWIKENANFQQDQYNVRDGVILYSFIRHEAYDKSDNLLPNDGTNFPGAEKKHVPVRKGKEGFVDDPAFVISSDDEEEDIDYQDDTEENIAAVKTHKFVIDLVVRYPDEVDDIILHWGMSRKQIGGWGTPDASFMPTDSKQWPDGLAC